MTRSQEIMAAVREMAPAGAPPRDIAARVHTSEQWAALALRVLAEAPDLTDAVIAGQMGLMVGYRMLCERRLAALPCGPPWPAAQTCAASSPTGGKS